MNVPSTVPASAATPDAAIDTPSRWARLWTGLRRRLIDAGLERLDVRWRFRIVVLACSLPFLAHIVWSATQQAELDKQGVRERARADATLMAARLNDHIEFVDGLLVTVAQIVGARPNDRPAIASLLENLRASVPHDVDDIVVWSSTGDSIAALDRGTFGHNVNVADQLYFRNAIARRGLVFGRPVRSRAIDADIVIFARPVVDANDEIVGVVSMSVRSTQLIRQLEPGGRIADESLVAITDDDGVFVARSGESERWIGKAVMDPPGLADSFATQAGTREVIGTDGQARLFGYAVVAGWPWLVIVGEPVERATGPVRERLSNHLVLGIAIFVFAMLVAERVAAWTSRPLMQLAADADRLESDLSYRSTVTTGGEIATLAATFNKMAAALETRDCERADSLARLRAIADNVPMHITYVDREERYRFVNAYAGAFRKIDPAAMIGKTVLEIRGREGYDVVAPALRRALAGERSSGEHSRMIDGRKTHFAITYVADFDADDRVCGVYTFAQDITQRKVAELARLESEQRLVTITDNLPAMICYVDEDRRFRFANRAFEKWFERPLNQIVGHPFDRIMAPELAAQYDDQFLRGIRGETVDCELEVPGSPDGPRWLNCSFIPDFDGMTGRVRGVYGMIHNVTKAKEAEQRLTRLAKVDTLTGIANRHQFDETFARALGERDDDALKIALMFLDIDHFKQVNDRCGHAGGDLLLKDFAQRLVDSVRQTDTVARLSGDEFVVLLEGLRSDDEPQFIARKIVAAIAKPFLLDGEAVRVTTSIGVALHRHAGEAASTLMKRADEALYQAKDAGRNTYRMAG